MSELQALLDVMNAGNYVILDTETTGLDWNDEIVQLAVIDADGQVLLNTLVRPTIPVPPSATRIHGITDGMVAIAPIWDHVAGQLLELLDGKTVIIYNADFDLRLLAQTCRAHRTAHLPAIPSVCAMLAYAEYFGDWDDYHGNYRWQRLEVACRHLHIPATLLHDAEGDCLLTLALIKKLASLQKKSADA